MNEYDVKTPYGNYQTKGEDDPYHILMKMASWNKELRSTISDVKYDLNGTIERQSQIIQDVDSITQSVIDITTEVDGANIRIGQLEVTSSQVAITVANIDSRMGIAESSISVQAGQISQKVSLTDYTGNTIASLINQSATTILLQASRIDLLGIVRVANSVDMGQTGSGGTKAIRFNGTDAWIYSTGNNLILDTTFINMQGQTEFNQDVNFNNVNVTGLNLPSAPKLPAHQYGATVSFNGTGDMTWVVNGTSFTYRRI